jgi:hypothetical protein
MAPDDDFDVEGWNRRLAETPAGPPDGFEPFDVTVDPRGTGVGGGTGAEVVAEEGFPSFAHSQWTVEGEIERFGAFGRGAARAQGWRRVVALVLVALLVLPVVVGLVEVLLRVLP